MGSEEMRMRVQDYTIDTTREAMAEAFRYAASVPENKLEWKPMDTGRSVMELCRELAQCAEWAYNILDGKFMTPSEEEGAQQQAEMDGWKTVADCEAAGKEKLGRYFEFLKAFPDERLGETMNLPFGPGGSMKAFTMAEMMDYPRWNATYHLGQIAYIQTLYGDKGMY